MEWNKNMSLEDQELMSKAVEEGKKTNNKLLKIAAARKLMNKYGYNSALDLMRDI